MPSWHLNPLETNYMQSTTNTFPSSNSEANASECFYGITYIAYKAVAIIHKSVISGVRVKNNSISKTFTLLNVPATKVIFKKLCLLISWNISSNEGYNIYLTNGGGVGTLELMFQKLRYKVSLNCFIQFMTSLRLINMLCVMCLPTG